MIFPYENDIHMNTPIVNHVFRFVQSIYREHLPHGFRDFQLDLSMEFKNDLISAGLKQQLPDETLEALALAALLHNTGCIEGQYERRKVSQTISQKYLAEIGCSPALIEEVLHYIEMTCPLSCPLSGTDQLIQQVKFKQAQRLGGTIPRKNVIGDLWP